MTVPVFNDSDQMDVLNGETLLSVDVGISIEELIFGSIVDIKMVLVVMLFFYIVFKIVRWD